MQILEHHQHRLLPREIVEKTQQRLESRSFFCCGVRPTAVPGSAGSDSRSASSAKSSVLPSSAKSTASLRQLRRGSVVPRKAGGAFELADDRIERAVL